MPNIFNSYLQSDSPTKKGFWHLVEMATLSSYMALILWVGGVFALHPAIFFGYAATAATLAVLNGAYNIAKGRLQKKIREISESGALEG